MTVARFAVLWYAQALLLIIDLRVPDKAEAVSAPTACLKTCKSLLNSCILEDRISHDALT